jgi:hypothetical protein
MNNYTRIQIEFWSENESWFRDLKKAKMIFLDRVLVRANREGLLMDVSLQQRAKSI